MPATRPLAHEPVRTLPSTGAGTDAVVGEGEGTLLPHVEFASGPGDRRKVAFREVRLFVAQVVGQAHAYYAVSLGDLTKS